MSMPMPSFMPMDMSLPDVCRECLWHISEAHMYMHDHVGVASVTDVFAYV